ncbi:MYND-type domain-containing protein [Aphis craccivora]|uniref:MYND-type domain-containing protein n=1 Tax=Aphis craccivora TaxID=307492 RepID=A0A6G0Y427_APHCR|nr:MYND-type domain-containing protein [Aphis craccivora]
MAHRDNPQPGGPDPPSQLRPGGWLLQYLIGAITNAHLVQIATSSSETGTGTPIYMTFKPAVQKINPQQSVLFKEMKATLLYLTTNSCYVKDCNNSATMMCSSCKTVMYCFHNCHRRDWYDNHIKDCERLLNKRLKRS